MNSKPHVSLWESVTDAVTIAVLLFGCLLSGLVCLVTLPSHLSEVEPLLAFLGFSQLINFAFLFGCLQEFKDLKAAAGGTSSKSPSEHQPSAEILSEEEEEEQVTPPEVEAAQFIRKARQRPRVDESE